MCVCVYAHATDRDGSHGLTHVWAAVPSGGQHSMLNVVCSRRMANAFPEYRKEIVVVFDISMDRKSSVYRVVYTQRSGSKDQMLVVCWLISV